MDNNHWTYRLFVERPELYLPSLEEAGARADAEVATIAALFDRYGVQAESRVLDVACGIGRHSIPLAERGYRVTGLDISDLYIEKAREHAVAAGVDVRFLAGDMQQAETLLEAGAPFDAFISMFTSNGYYGRKADVDLFSQLSRLASPEAVLVVLTANRDWLIRNFDPEGMGEAGGIRILQTRTLDLETSSVRSEWEFYRGEGDDLRLELRLPMDHRVYSLHELKALLEEAGWGYLRGLGSYRGVGPGLSDLTYDSMDIWLVARAGPG